MEIKEVYSYTIDRLPLQTGDVICTVDGNERIVSGQFWRLVGKLIPGDVDHIVIYTGPGGLCVEANGEGVVTFEITESTWDPIKIKDLRGGLIDNLYGIVYPLQNKGFSNGKIEKIRIGVANYCLKQAFLKKPYNLNFFDSSTEKAFYCSQLAYKAYSKFKINLNTGKGVPNVFGTDKIIFPQEIWEGFYHKKKDE